MSSSIPFHGAVSYEMADAGSVFNNPEFAGVEVPVFKGFENNPYLVTKRPGFVFRSDFLWMFVYLLRRIVGRTEFAPRRGAYLGGPKGCGKTTSTEQAHAAVGLPLASLTIGNEWEPAAALSAMEVVGGDTLRVDGVLIMAAKGGFPVVLNEISKTTDGKLSLLYDLIDRGHATTEDGQRILAKPGFCVWATDNTLGAGDQSDDGQSPDSNVLSDALRDRFVLFDFGYGTQAEEEAIVAAELKAMDPKVDPTSAAVSTIITQAVSFGRAIRASNIPGGCSTRRVIALADAVLEMTRIRRTKITLEPFRQAYELTIRAAVEHETHKATLDELFKTEVLGQKKAA